MPLVYREVIVLRPCPPPNPTGVMCEEREWGWVWEDDPPPTLGGVSGADYRNVTVGGINTGAPNYGLPGGPDNTPPDNVDWDVWFDNMLDYVEDLRDSMMGGTRGSIPWAPPLPAPDDPPPTDPIDKDPGPDGWPDWLPKPDEAPCQKCNYIPNGNPNDMSGGSIMFESKYGTTIIREKKLINGKYVDNPLLSKLGIKINGGQCECEKTIGPDDFDPPPPGTPSDPDCEKSVKDFLKNFPDIDGCDKATKKRLTKAMYDACVAANKMMNSQQFSDLYNATWIAGKENDSLRELLNCLSNPDRFSMIKKLRCGQVTGKPNLTGLEMAYSDTDTGEIILDFQKIDNYLNQSSNRHVPKDDFVSYTMLHELTHHCCKHAKRSGFDVNGNEIGIAVSCIEIDRVFLGFLMFGDKIWNRPTKDEIDELCKDKYSRQEKATLNSFLQSKGLPPLGPDWIVSGNFAFHLITGALYTIPNLGKPITVITPPPGGYNLCP